MSSSVPPSSNSGLPFSSLLSNRPLSHLSSSLSSSFSRLSHSYQRLRAGLERNERGMQKRMWKLKKTDDPDLDRTDKQYAAHRQIPSNSSLSSSSNSSSLSFSSSNNSLSSPSFLSPDLPSSLSGPGIRDADWSNRSDLKSYLSSLSLLSIARSHSQSAAKGRFGQRQRDSNQKQNRRRGGGGGRVLSEEKHSHYEQYSRIEIDDFFTDTWTDDEDDDDDNDDEEDIELENGDDGQHQNSNSKSKLSVLVTRSEDTKEKDKEKGNSSSSAAVNSKQLEEGKQMNGPIEISSDKSISPAAGNGVTEIFGVAVNLNGVAPSTMSRRFRLLMGKGRFSSKERIEKRRKRKEKRVLEYNRKEAGMEIIDEKEEEVREAKLSDEAKKKEEAAKKREKDRELKRLEKEKEHENEAARLSEIFHFDRPARRSVSDRDHLHEFMHEKRIMHHQFDQEKNPITNPSDPADQALLRALGLNEKKIDEWTVQDYALFRKKRMKRQAAKKRAESQAAAAAELNASDESKKRESDNINGNGNGNNGADRYMPSGRKLAHRQQLLRSDSEGNKIGETLTSTLSSLHSNSFAEKEKKKRREIVTLKPTPNPSLLFDSVGEKYGLNQSLTLLSFNSLHEARMEEKELNWMRANAPAVLAQREWEARKKKEAEEKEKEKGIINHSKEQEGEDALSQEIEAEMSRLEDERRKSKLSKEVELVAEEKSGSANGIREEGGEEKTKKKSDSSTSQHKRTPSSTTADKAKQLVSKTSINQSSLSHSKSHKEAEKTKSENDGFANNESYSSLLENALFLPQPYSLGKLTEKGPSPHAVRLAHALGQPIATSTQIQSPTALKSPSAFSSQSPSQSSLSSSTLGSSLSTGHLRSSDRTTSKLPSGSPQNPPRPRTAQSLHNSSSPSPFLSIGTVDELEDDPQSESHPSIFQVQKQRALRHTLQRFLDSSHPSSDPHPHDQHNKGKTKKGSQTSGLTPNGDGREENWQSQESQINQSSAAQVIEATKSRLRNRAKARDRDEPEMDAFEEDEEKAKEGREEEQSYGAISKLVNSANT